MVQKSQPSLLHFSYFLFQHWHHTLQLLSLGPCAPSCCPLYHHPWRDTQWTPTFLSLHLNFSFFFQSSMHQIPDLAKRLFILQLFNWVFVKSDLYTVPSNLPRMSPSKFCYIPCPLFISLCLSSPLPCTSLSSQQTWDGKLAKNVIFKGGLTDHQNQLPNFIDEKTDAQRDGVTSSKWHYQWVRSQEETT